MKLARVIYRNNNPWRLRDGTKINPPIGTTVQYECDTNDWYSVYFPGVHGCASMPGSMFSTYFKDLDDETS